MRASSPPRRSTLLATTRGLLRVLIVANIVMGILIGALLLSSLIWGDVVMHALGVRSGLHRATLVLGMRAIMGIGILAAPLMHLIFIRLLAFLDTVVAGTPFLAENAARLQTVAWAVVGLECLHITVGLIVARVSSQVQSLEIPWNLPVTRVLTILLLFVLAGVFDEGAVMQDEISATV